MKKVVIPILGVLLVLGSAVGLAMLLKPGDNNSAAPGATGEKAPAGLERFYEQSLEWEKCGRHNCAKVTVPVDYSDPDGETLELSVRRVAATGKTNRVLFVNPGGPGGSATQFASTVASAISTDMRKAWDVVGVDPRGVGNSTPLQCLDDAEFDEWIAGDPTPDTKEELDEFKAAMRQMAEACENNSGKLASHISTEEAARDQDVVRALLGQEKLHWYGASYGTQLGATYANLFPANVGQMVLDGAVDVSLDSVGQSLGQAEGFHRALVAFLENCVKRSSCPTGDTVDEGLKRVGDFLESLDSEPLEVSGGRTLTESHGLYGVAVALYTEDAWPLLRTALKDAFVGDGQMLMYLADAYFERGPDGSFGSNAGQVINAISCLDTPDGPTVKEVPKLMKKFDEVSPVFGRFLAWGTAGCNYWPLESNSPQQEVKAEGAPPILVVGTTRDPATPYEWAEALATQLDSGVLLSREGDGHTAYLMNNKCILDTIEKFYLKGTVPEDGKVCAEKS